jgi:hypothetical protein
VHVCVRCVCCVCVVCVCVVCVLCVCVCVYGKRAGLMTGLSQRRSNYKNQQHAERMLLSWLAKDFSLRVPSRTTVCVCVCRILFYAYIYIGFRDYIYGMYTYMV